MVSASAVGAMSRTQAPGFSPTNVPTSQSAIENYLKDTGGLVIASLYAGPLPATDWVCATAPVPARPSSWGGLKLRYR